MGPEVGAFGAVALLLLILLGLAFLLFLVPIPLWVAAWASGAYAGTWRPRGSAR